jgi:hypothetical protein
MIRKKRKTTKYVFILKNVNTEQVDKKYDISLISNIRDSEDQPDNTTKLTELLENNNEKSHELISFLDESKRLYQCNVSMIDFITLKNVNTTKYNCYWCRHCFNSYPIGCPINYVSNKAIKSYHSEVSKDNYIIKENTTKYKSTLINSNIPFIFTILKEKKKSSLTIDKEDYFITDGVFCSFNCCKAFIKDNKHNILYENSESLLIKLFSDIMKTNNLKLNTITISPAPSWRLLKEYGGNLTINEFRENFNKVSYDCHGSIKQVIFRPVGHLYEEKINF